MSSNQPLKLPPGYFAVRGPLGYAIFADAMEYPGAVPQEETTIDQPNTFLIRVTPWRTTRHAAVTYFALNRLGVKNIHSEP